MIKTSSDIEMDIETSIVIIYIASYPFYLIRGKYKGHYQKFNFSLTLTHYAATYI